MPGEIEITFSVNKRIIKYFLFGIGAYLLAILGFYIYYLARNGFSRSPAEWGQFGDYFGGMLNPIISLISLLVLASIAVIISKNEAAREEKLLDAQKDLQYNLLLSNLRYNEYHKLLISIENTETILDKSYSVFVDRYDKFIKIREANALLFDWEKIKDVLVPLDDLSRRLKQNLRGAPPPQVKMYNDEKTKIAPALVKIKEFIRESVLHPLNKN